MNQERDHSPLADPPREPDTAPHGDTGAELPAADGAGLPAADGAELPAADGAGLPAADGAGLPAADASTARALRLAARDAFAQQGYDGASIRAITAAAGANLGAVTYHFGSKRALYEAVVEDVLGPLAECTIAAATSSSPPLDRAGDVVRAFFGYFGENYDVPRLMLQELANGRELPPVAERNMARILGALTSMVQAGQADGSMRPGEARLMALAIVSHPLHVHLVRGPLRSFAAIDIDDPVLRERIVENAVRFVRGGLAAVPNGKTEP